VIDAAEAHHAQLIVIDTLSRALAGGNENAPEDMGAFICNVAEIKHQTNAHVGIVHHGTKASNGSNPRGHSSLEGADDAYIQVVKLEDGSRVATLVHAKDDADGMRWGFALDVVEQGIDADGDPITALIARELTEAPEKAAKAPKPNASEQVALDILDRAMKEGAGTTASVGPNHEERPVIAEHVWRQRYYSEARQGDQQGTKRMAFVRAMTGLQSKNIIAARDGFIWRPEVW
jgi:AAA domain